MFDRLMFWIYSFVTAYHSIRGSGVDKYDSVKGAYIVVSEQKMEKPISEFQTNMWKAMKKIVEESKI